MKLITETILEQMLVQSSRFYSLLRASARDLEEVLLCPFQSDNLIADLATSKANLIADPNVSDRNNSQFDRRSAHK
jgi:hypothetical protein